MAIITILGIVKLGCTFVPVDVDAPPSWTAPLLLEAGIRALVTGEPCLTSEIESAGIRVFNFEIGSLLRHGDTYTEPRDIDRDSHLYIMFTSGTTGRPKGVLIPHRGVLRLVLGANFLEIFTSDRVLQCASLAFDASTLEVWGALLNGATLVLDESRSFDPRDLADRLAKEQITVLWLTAALFHLAAKHDPFMFKNLRVLLAGGDVLMPDAVKTVLSACPGIELVNGYGPTENTTFTCCHRMTIDNPPNSRVPIGKPVSGTTVVVVDENLVPVGSGSSGELLACGDGVALGYVNNEPANRISFINYPSSTDPLCYRTGDVVYLRPDGLIEFEGRRDRLTKIRGHRVSLDEVESVISELPGVVACEASLTDPTGTGQVVLTAYVQLLPDDEDTDGRAKLFRSTLRRKIPQYMIPDRIVFCDTLQISSNGKLRRNREARELSGAD